jgi:predicted amidohydrolase YtcJ
MYAGRLGERWRRTNRFRHLLNAGVTLAGGSDAPITPVNPVAGIRAAMNHPNPDQRLTGNEALALFTTGAAFALNMEQRCGTLEPGKDADFTILSADPRIDAECHVLATFRAGQCIYKNDDLELEE